MSDRPTWLIKYHNGTPLSTVPQAVEVIADTEAEAQAWFLRRFSTATICGVSQVDPALGNSPMDRANRPIQFDSRDDP